MGRGSETQLQVGENISFLNVAPWGLKYHDKMQTTYKPTLYANDNLVILFVSRIGIQMNQNELTKAFMMISNWKKTFGLQGFHMKKPFGLQGFHIIL